MRKHSAFLMVAAYVAASLSGCSIVGQPHYDITVKNISEIKLENVNLSTDTFAIPIGVLPPQVSKSNIDHIGPFPHHASITWRLPGPAYMPTVSDSINIPATRPELVPGRDQHYELLFELDGKHVKSRYVVKDYTWMRED